MLEVWKYEVEIAGSWRMPMPLGARVIGAAFQHGQPVMWALVDPKEQAVAYRTFRFVGTGHPIAEQAQQLTHVATFGTDPKMTEVYHLFEVGLAV